MKTSLLLAAIILGLAAAFGLQQKEKIKTLTIEWEELKATALEKNISSDPTATFSLQRVRSESNRAAREEAINNFAVELVAFAQKMEAAKKDGTDNEPEMMKEVMVFIDKLTNMSATDLKSLVKALSADTSIKDDTKRELIMMSIMMISADNPEAALAIISESSDSLGLESRHRQLLPMIIQQYATKDPAAAATWVAENSEQLGDKAEEFKSQIIVASTHQDFSSALAMIDTLDLEDPSQIYPLLAVGVKAGDQDKFMQALKNSDVTDEQRQAALITLINSPFIKEDFKAATTWLEGPALSADDRESFIGGLNFYSVRENPRQWLSWISSQEIKDETSDRTNRQILEGWTRENYVAAGEWVGSQESGPAKNAAVETYAGTLAPHEPAAAAEWAETLPPGDDRTKLLQTIHQSLKQKDPNAAQALAEKHQLQ